MKPVVVNSDKGLQVTPGSPGIQVLTHRNLRLRGQGGVEEGEKEWWMGYRQFSTISSQINNKQKKGG